MKIFLKIKLNTVFHFMKFGVFKLLILINGLLKHSLIFCTGNDCLYSCQWENTF